MSDHTADVAAVLAAHAGATSHGGLHSDDWQCSCGWVFTAPGSYAAALPTHRDHLAAALLASEPLAQALAAVETLARVEALADHWRRVGGPDSPKAYADRLRAALRPEGGAQ